jgi:phosphate transport system substrate-binding protein
MALPVQHHLVMFLRSLWGDQSFWISVKPAEKADPKVREFIRFVLSREGQELVQRDGKYLPLTAAVANSQLRALDEAAK